MHQAVNSVPTTQDIQPTTMESITRLVANAYRVTIQDLKGRSRRRKICRPRQVAMFLIRDYFGEGKSFPIIGRWFGHRDHSTVFHAWRLIPELMEKNVKFYSEVNGLRSQIRSDATSSLENCTPQQPVVEPEILIVVPESFKPLSALASPHASADVIEAVATYFSIDSRSLKSEPNTADEYLCYCWQVYIHIAKLLEGKGSVSKRAFQNHLVFVSDSLMKHDIRQIWSQLIKV